MALTISLSQVSKRYRSQWIFKGISYTFEAGKRYAVLGANGSGKSTLLRIIAGMQHVNKGQVRLEQHGKEISSEMLFQLMSYAAPGMELVEEMSLNEFFHFHFTFKKILPGHTVVSIINAMGMEKVRNKYIHEFSSGMKQRVKLAQAFFSDTPVLLLDEPCSNLDLAGVNLYQQWLQDLSQNRMVIIASNDEREYPGVDASFSVEDFR